MARNTLTSMPVETIEAICDVVDDAALLSLRLTGRQISSAIFEKFTHRFFASITTSLMGTSLRRLEVLSQHPEFRKHVRHICLADDCEQVDPYNSGEILESPNIWPRDNEGVIKAYEVVGVSSFLSMLREKKFCPVSITVRDCRISPKNMRHCTEAVQRQHSPYHSYELLPSADWAFARGILLGADLAIVFLDHSRRKQREGKVYLNLPSLSRAKKPESVLARPIITEVKMTMSPLHQGQGTRFSLLASATILCSSCWLQDAAASASLLKTLSITSIDVRDVERLPIPTFQLEQLECRMTYFTAAQLHTILSNSKASLQKLNLESCVLEDGSSWQSLLTAIGEEASSLNEWHLSYCKQKVGIEFEYHVEYNGFSLDSVPAEYRAGLKLRAQGAESGSQLSGLDTIDYQGPQAGLVLQRVASYAQRQLF